MPQLLGIEWIDIFSSVERKRTYLGMVAHSIYTYPVGNMLLVAPLFWVGENKKLIFNLLLEKRQIKHYFELKIINIGWEIRELRAFEI